MFEQVTEETQQNDNDTSNNKGLLVVTDKPTQDHKPINVFFKQIQLCLINNKKNSFTMMTAINVNEPDTLLYRKQEEHEL